MTSNVGTEHIRRASRIGFGGNADEIDQNDMRRKVDDALKSLFRPEFLNRIDATIIFHPLTNEEIQRITTLMLKRVQQQLDEHQMQLSVQQNALALLARRGYDPAFGARPLRRIITNLIEDPLAEGFLNGNFREGDTIIVNSEQDELRLRSQRQIESESSVAETHPEESPALVE